MPIVRVATSLPGIISSAFSAGSVIDNVMLSVGDRILIKNQTNDLENGIYIVSATGAPVRSSDAQAGISLSGVVTVVTDGKTLSGTSWMCSNAYNSGIVSVNGLTFESHPARVSVRVATTMPGMLNSYTSGSIVDTVTLSAGDHILIKNQISTVENGVYVIQSSSAPVRSQYYAIGNTMSGITVSVTDGSMNKNTLWMCTNIFNAGIIGSNGLSFNVVCYPKAPVRVATTTAGTLATSFTAGQTVDSVVLMVGDRILLKNQVFGLENGVYITQATGAPLRSLDALNGTSLSGVAFVVTDGTLNAGSMWMCTNSYATGVVSVNALTFSMYPNTSSSYKLPVRVATTVAGSLSLYMTGAIIDNVTLATGDRLLVKNQAVSTENGIYIISTGPPVRTNDASIGSSMSGFSVTVTDGSINASTNWQCNNTHGNGIIASNGLSFVQNERPTGTGCPRPVRVATTHNGSLAMSFAAGQVVDNVTLIAGDRILIKDQELASENGVYTITVGRPVRSSDAMAVGILLTVTEGTHASSIWMSCATEAGTVSFANVYAPSVTVSNTSGSLLPVRVATIMAGTLALSYAAGQLVNNVRLVVGDRILIKDQELAAENGVYIITTDIPMRSDDIIVPGLLVADATSGSVYIAESGMLFSLVTSVSETGYVLPVRVATTQSSVMSVYTPGHMINNVTLMIGDRILIKDQINSVENGVYIIQASGRPIRAPDAAVGMNVSGVCVYVLESDLTYRFGSCIIGTDPLSVSVVRAETGPVRVATRTSMVLSSINIGSIIDNVVLSAGDRILIKNQTNAIENGIYIVTSRGLVRANDSLIGVNCAGVLVSVTEGAVFSGYVFKGVYPGVIGTDPLSFDIVYPMTIDSGTKAPVIAATVSAGNLATSFAAGQILDGVKLSVNDRILIKNQTSGVENGVYVVTDGIPVRTTDALTGVSFSGVGVPVTQGGLSGGTIWMCSNAYATGIIGVNALYFIQVYPSTTGVKQPVRVATAIAGTLSMSFYARRTIDSVVLSVGDRILIKNQDNPVENGVYTVNASGAPTRSVDTAMGSSMSGHAVFVTDGAISGGTMWTCTNGYTTGSVGVNALTFAQTYPTYNTGSKLPVRVATTTTGTLASAFAAGQVIDTVTLTTGDRILIKNQTNGVENGLYVVTAGAPTRAADSAAGGNVSGMTFLITDGVVNGDTQWVCTNTFTAGVAGVNVLRFSLLSSTTASGYYTGISDIWKLSDIQATGVSGGNPTAANTWNTRTLNSLATSNNKVTAIPITNITTADVFTTGSAHSLVIGDKVLVSMTNTVPSSIGNFTILTTPTGTTFTLNNGSGVAYNITSVLAVTGFVAKYTSFVELVRPGNNTFTLQPGSYRIQATVPGFRVDAHKCRLYNVSTATVIGYGTNGSSMDNIHAGVTQSELDAYVTITGATVYRIEHAATCSTTGLPPLTGNGFGVAAGMSTIETYTTVSITKIA